MTALVTVTIDRTSLSLSGLAITSDNTGTYTLTQDGLGRVGVAQREKFAEDSNWVNGRLRTAVVRDEPPPLTLGVRVQSTTTSGLNTAVSALETALGQFSYTVTVAVDGSSKVWTASPATWNSTDGLITPGRVLDHYEDLAISIPVYPVAS